LNHKKPVLIVRRLIDEKGRFVGTEIDIKSVPLCEALIEIHKDVDGLELTRSAPTVSLSPGFLSRVLFTMAISSAIPIFSSSPTMA